MRLRRTSRATITTGDTNENGSTDAVGDTASGSKSRTTGGSGAALKGVFRAAVKSITRRNEDEPPPPARRRSGETDKGFVPALQRAGNQSPQRTGIDAGKAFGEAAKAAMQHVTRIPAHAYAAAVAYLGDMLGIDPYWPPDAGIDDAIDESFDSQQNRYFPQP